MINERDAGQAFKFRIPSRYDAVHNPMEAQQLAAEDLKVGKIDKDMFDMIIAACSRKMNKIKESFDRLSGRNHFAESRLRAREVYDTAPPVNVARQQFTQDGGFSMEVECAGEPFTVKIDAEGRTFIQAEDVSAIPLPAQKAAARKARLVWHAENSKPQWGFKGGFRLESIQEEEVDYNAFNTKLAKLAKGLKKDVGATKIRQNYKGTGKRKHRRQLYIDFPGGKSFDLWLDSGFVRFGGVMRTNIPDLDFQDTPEATYREIVRRIKAWLG